MQSGSLSRAVTAVWREMGVVAPTGLAWHSLVLMVLMVPVIMVGVPPLVDYPNHLARFYVIASLQRDPVLAQMFSIEWSLIPNILPDLLVPPLVDLVGIDMAGKLFLAATFVTLSTGPALIQRALTGRFHTWPLFAGVLVYNEILLWGLLNYLFGVGLALWALAAWIALRDRAPWQRLTMSVAAVLVLFTCHLSALGVYGLGLLCFELCYLVGMRPDRRRLAVDFAVFAGPFAIAVLLLAASPTRALARALIWSWDGKLDGVMTILRTYADVSDLVFAAPVLAGGVWALLRGALSIHPAGRVLLVLGTVVFLVMPTMLFGSWMADQRLPIALAFLLIGFTHLKLPTHSVRRTFQFLVVALVAARATMVGLHWMEMDRMRAQVTAALAQVEPGASILVVHADHPIGRTDLVRNAVSHFPCLAVIERSALTATLFAVPGKHVLNVRPDYRDLVDITDGDPPHEADLLRYGGTPHYWDGWADRYDYVFLLYNAPDAPNLAPEVLRTVAEGHMFRLYQVDHDI